MAKLTLGEAAKAAEMGKTSLRRAIDAGRISAERLENGVFVIDPSELARFIDARRAAPPSSPLGRPPAHQAAPPEPEGGAPAISFSGDVEALAQERARAIIAEAEARNLRERLDELLADRDAWRAQAERLAIAHHPPAPTPEPQPRASGFWSRLFKG